MKFKIRTKVLVTVSVFLVLALGITDTVWYQAVRPILTTRLQEAQHQIGFRAADKVKDFLDAKVRTLIVHAQSAAFLSQNKDLERLELLAFFSQDQDIDKISFINARGMEEIAFTRTGEVAKTDLEDKKNSPAFVTTTFRFGKEYISDVTFNNNKAVITIAVPITIPEVRQRLTGLTTESSGILKSQESVLGVLEINVSMDHLFEELTALGTQQSGYLYVIDKKGSVIAYKDTSTAGGSMDFTNFPPVKQFVNLTNQDTATSQTANLIEYVNEKNEQVLGTFVSVPKINWAVIIQQPRSLALADFSKVTTFALFLLLGGILVCTPITFFLAKKFTDPIQSLVKGAHIFGEGKLDYRVSLRTNDEFDELAGAFNQMATNLDDSTQKLERNKDIISAERNKLAVVLSGISDAVIAIGLNRQILLFNTVAQELTGYKEIDVLGKPLDQLIKLYFKENIIQATTYSPIRLDNYEGILWSQKNLKLVTPTQHELFVNVVASQIKEGEKVGVGCILTMHDISKEHQLEEMKLDFVSMAAHELRTPITSIQGYAGLLKQAATKLSPDDNDSLQKLLLSSEILANLVDNLLNVSRIEQGRLILKITHITMGKLVKEVVDTIMPTAIEKKQKITILGNHEVLPQVLGDPARIKQVVTNLLSNAIKYTPELGSIIISISEQQDANKRILVVAVSDNGQGIAKEAMPHLFTKFFRAANPLVMEAKGTGLGLYISKSIIDMHMGKIWATSEKERGSTFAFALPIPSEADLKEYEEKAKNEEAPRRGVIISPTSSK